MKLKVKKDTYLVYGELNGIDIEIEDVNLEKICKKLYREFIYKKGYSKKIVQLGKEYVGITNKFNTLSIYQKNLNDKCLRYDPFYPNYKYYTQDDLLKIYNLRKLFSNKYVYRGRFLKFNKDTTYREWIDILLDHDMEMFDGHFRMWENNLITEFYHQTTNPYHKIGLDFITISRRIDRLRQSRINIQDNIKCQKTIFKEIVKLYRMEF